MRVEIPSLSDGRLAYGEQSLRTRQRWCLVLLVVFFFFATLPSQRLCFGKSPTNQKETPAAGADDAQSTSALGKKLAEVISKFGPLSVFFLMIASGVGLHFPEDMVIIPAGWEIATGNFSLLSTFFSAYFGVVLGDAGWFLLCRFFGKRLLRSRWMLRAAHPRRILEIKYLIDHYGAWVLVVCRLVPGARTPSLTVGGLMRLKGWIFLAVELPMVLLTVVAQLALGYYAAQGMLMQGMWQKVIIAVGVVVALLAFVVVVVVRRRLASGQIRLQRASVTWLRELRGA